MNEFYTRDKTIRVALVNELNTRSADHRLVEEFSINKGTARIDLVLLDNEIHGYELKGDLDNLDRLENQARIYSLIFDKVTLVVGKKHLHHSLQIIPEWWGIKVAIMKSEFREIKLLEIREPLRNPNQDIYTFTSLLWKNEMLDILEKLKFEIKGYASKPKQEIQSILIENYDEMLIKNYAREQIAFRYRD